ncbi:hypothetical protein HBB16_11005 [Pseudonocardia sp. MCCB 268]|nr:hypothetical protein [Pseudonocardia cytotoxica]
MTTGAGRTFRSGRGCYRAPHPPDPGPDPGTCARPTAGRRTTHRPGVGAADAARAAPRGPG